MDHRPNKRAIVGKPATWMPLGVCLTVLALALVACGGGNQTAKEAATITVQEVVNRVEVNALDPATDQSTQSAFAEVKLGQSLHTGNQVKTYLDSQARIDIAIDQFTRVSRTAPETVWRMGGYALDGGAIVELDQGEIIVFDQDNGDGHWPLHVVTPAGTAAARGTWMAVGFDTTTGVADVQCFRGLCELENDHGYRVLTDEKSTSATADTVPVAAKFMTELQVQRFWDIPEAVSGEFSIPTRISAIEANAKETEAENAHFNRKKSQANGEAASLKKPAAGADGADAPGNNNPISAANDGQSDDSATATVRGAASVGPGRVRSERADASDHTFGFYGSTVDIPVASPNRWTEFARSWPIDDRATAGVPVLASIAYASSGNGVDSGSEDALHGKSVNSLRLAGSGSNGDTSASGSLTGSTAASASGQPPVGPSDGQSAAGLAALVSGQQDPTMNFVDSDGKLVLSFDPEILNQQFRYVLTRLGWDENEVASFLLRTQTMSLYEIGQQMAELIKAADELVQSAQNESSRRG